MLCWFVDGGVDDGVRDWEGWAGLERRNDGVKFPSAHTQVRGVGGVLVAFSYLSF